MRALISGFSLDGANGRSRVQFESLSNGLARSCELLGWDWEHDRMLVDTNPDRLAEADVLFMGIAPFNGIPSRFIFGALDAIAKARQYNCGLVFYVTDWQTNLLLSSARTMAKKPTNYIKPLLSGRTDYEWAKENVDLLERITRAFIDKQWPETIIPMHTWHNDPDRDQRIQTHIPARRQLVLDPTTVTTDFWSIDEPDWDAKKRQWVCAALGDRARWILDQGITWPAEIRGGATFKIRDGQAAPRVKEHEIVELYRQSWAACSPPTNMFKTGWWRTRYSYATRAGAVLYGDPEELRPIGPHFGYSVQQIESFTDAQLKELTIAQRTEYESRIEPRDQVLLKISDAAKRAIEDIS